MKALSFVDLISPVTWYGTLLISAVGCTAQILIPLPGEVIFSSSIQSSFGRSDEFQVSGTAAEGSTVYLYTNPLCSGTPVASGTAVNFASGITIPVSDVSTRIYARSRYLDGPYSPCSRIPAAYTKLNWKWVSGSPSAPFASSYGTINVSSSSNYPRARGAVTSFLTSDGIQWWYGGNSTSGFGDIGDLWQYDPKTNLWTWESGPSTLSSLGSYGTIGVTNPSNLPPARSAAYSWVGRDDDLYIFGGFQGSGSRGLADLWKYSTRDSTWTWISGTSTADSLGNYGTMGVASTSVFPRSRWAGHSWQDSNGMFWVMAGNGTSVFHSDLWKFNPDTLEWTWVKGPQTPSQYGVYPPLGTSTTSSNPGARGFGCGWKDANDDYWLTGGVGYGSSGGTGRLSDLWKYSPRTNQWTWVSGSQNVDVSPSYGIKGVPSSSNQPGGRRNSHCWVDSRGRFWLFGGEGFTESAPGVMGYKNDLWVYEPLSNQWTWVSGSRGSGLTGSYASNGFNPLNDPGSRSMVAVINDLKGQVWLFGGWGFDGAAAFSMLGNFWSLSIP